MKKTSKTSNAILHAAERAGRTLPTEADVVALADAAGVSRAVATQILTEHGGPLSTLADVPAWLDERAAARLGHVLRFMDRVLWGYVDGAKTKVDTSRAAARFMHARIGSLTHEEMWIVALDGQNRVREAVMVSKGGLHGCAVRARDVLREAIRAGASAIVLSHNHPSGDPTPSVEDIAMTSALVAAAEVVGVDVVDHVIVTSDPGRYASMLDLGLMGAR